MSAPTKEKKNTSSVQTQHFTLSELTLLINFLLKDNYKTTDVKRMQQIIDKYNLEEDANKLIAQTPTDERLDDSWPLGWWSAIALGKAVGNEQAVTALIAALRNAPTEDDYAETDHNDNENEELQEILAEREAIAKAAAFALTNLGATSVQPLISILESDDERDMRQWAAIILGQIGDKRAVPSLCQAILNDQDTYVSSSAASALGHIGDLRAVKPLIEALQKIAPARGDGGLAFGATLALELLSTPEAVKALEWTQLQPDNFFGKDNWGSQVKPEAARFLAIPIARAAS